METLALSYEPLIRFLKDDGWMQGRDHKVYPGAQRVGVGHFGKNAKIADDHPGPGIPLIFLNDSRQKIANLVGGPKCSLALGLLLVLARGEGRITIMDAHG